jgi:hypothetical protein
VKRDASLLHSLEVERSPKGFLKKTGAAREEGGILTENTCLFCLKHRKELFKSQID